MPLSRVEPRGICDIAGGPHGITKSINPFSRTSINLILIMFLREPGDPSPGPLSAFNCFDCSQGRGCTSRRLQSLTASSPRSTETRGRHGDRLSHLNQSFRSADTSPKHWLARRGEIWRKSRLSCLAWQIYLQNSLIKKTTIFSNFAAFCSFLLFASVSLSVLVNLPTYDYMSSLAAEQQVSSRCPITCQVSVIVSQECDGIVIERLLCVAI